jgi:hypothetical protein
MLILQGIDKRKMQRVYQGRLCCPRAFHARYTSFLYTDFETRASSPCILLVKCAHVTIRYPYLSVTKTDFPSVLRAFYFAIQVAGRYRLEISIKKRGTLLATYEKRASFSYPLQKQPSAKELIMHREPNQAQEAGGRRAIGSLCMMSD